MTKIELFENIYNESSVDTANFLRNLNSRNLGRKNSFNSGDKVHVDIEKSLHSQYVPATVVQQLGPKTIKVSITKEDYNKYLGQKIDRSVTTIVDLQNVKEYVFQR